MTIKSGVRLGPYEVTSAVGAGGMGEVWRARDTRLDRDVAIKVLPSSFAADAKLRLRFEREAKTISALNHPHICTLHDIGNHDGVDYLVMEMIDGESLADRLTRGALPLEQVLRYGAQIASALDAAHRRGIVHRDLKPGNVMLTKSGAKLLDFGLAKSGASSPAIDIGTGIATAEKPLTEEGMILGTFQYMAPEQLEGTEADARTDIFALGALLYEMATGRRAFHGTSKTSLIAAIVGSDPAPVSSIAPTSPPALEHVVRKCLAKDPDARWQSAHDVAGELLWIAEAGSQAGMAAPLTRRRRLRERAVWIALGLLALVAGVLGAAILRRPAERPGVVRFSFSPVGKYLFDFKKNPPVVSPDGRHIAYVTIDGSEQRLWVRSLDSAEPRLIAGGTEGNRPFWSPDSKQLAYFSAGKLRKIALGAETHETICSNASYGTGGAWSHDGWIVFGRLWGDGLYRVRAAGGAPERITTLAANESVHSFPKFFPDGKNFAFLAVKGGAEGTTTIKTGSTEGSAKPEVLTRADTLVAVLASGHLVFVRDAILFAQKLDFSSRKLTGEPFRVLDRVPFSHDWMQAPVSISDAGTFVFAESLIVPLQLTVFDRGGKALESIGKASLLDNPQFSPDGRRIVVTKVDEHGSSDLWMFDLERGIEIRLTQHPAQESSPVWSPDGTRVAYFSDRHGLYDVFEKNLESGEERLVSKSGEDKGPTSWSPDGRTILVSVTRAETRGDIHAIDVASGETTAIVATPYADENAVFSPDGRFIAYTTAEQGTPQVHITSYPPAGVPLQITSDGGSKPVWNRSAPELFYLTLDRKVMSVRYTVERGVLRPQPPVELFTAPPFLRDVSYRLFDVSSDGTRFLFLVPPEGQQPLAMNVVLNWSVDAGK